MEFGPELEKLKADPENFTSYIIFTADSKGLIVAETKNVNSPMLAYSAAVLKDLVYKTLQNNFEGDSK